MRKRPCLRHGHDLAGRFVALVLVLVLAWPASAQDTDGGAPANAAEAEAAEAEAPEASPGPEGDATPDEAGEAAVGGVPAAQPVPLIDYEAWAESVARTERVIESGEATAATLELLRARLVQQREAFLAAANVNAVGIDRVERQLATLGPPPAEGETESEAVAERRAALNAELQELRAPVQRARAAFAEADALVAAIDSVLRARQASEVLQRWPLPVNPLNWPPVLLDVVNVAMTVPQEIVGSLRVALEEETLRERLPVAAVIALIGAFMLFRAPYWIGRFDNYLSGLRRGPMNIAMQGVLALLQLGLPALGLIAILFSLQVTGLTGPIGTALLFGLAAAIFVSIVGFWLHRRLFPSDGPASSPLSFGEAEYHAARLVGWFLVVGVSVHAGIDRFAEAADLPPTTRAFVVFCVTVPVAVLLFRLAQLMAASTRRQMRESSEAAGFSAGVVRTVAQLARLLCVVAVVAGLAGYITLAERLVIPAAITFYGFGLIAWLQMSFAAFYASMRNRDRSAEDGLVPTLFGGVLLIASLPLLALLWGALPTDLAELWTNFLGGFSIGEVNVAPSTILTFLLVFAIGFAITRLIQGALRTTILPKTNMDLGARNAIVAGLGYLGVFLAALLAVTTAGIDLSNLAILASALAVGVGFGLQTIVSNFVSGIILLVERPVSEGDWIEVAGQMGYVRRIAVRATRIETFDRTDVIVPNADLISGQVTNWTRGNLIGRAIVPVGVAYGTDTRQVEAILMEIAEAHPMVVLNPAPQVLFMGFGDSSLNFEIRAILRDINFLLSVKSDMNHAIARRFAEAGIEIPFPQRDLWLRNAEVLAAGAAVAGGERRLHAVGGGAAASTPSNPTPPAARQRDAHSVAETASEGDGDGDGDGR